MPDGSRDGAMEGENEGEAVVGVADGSIDGW